MSVRSPSESDLMIQGCTKSAQLAQETPGKCVQRNFGYGNFCTEELEKGEVKVIYRRFLSCVLAFSFLLKKP